MASLDFDGGLRAVLLDVAVEELQGDAGATANDENNILLGPLGVGQTLAQRVAEVAAVSCSQGGTARDLDKETGIVGEANAGHGGIGVGDDHAVGVGVVRPLPRLGGDAGAAKGYCDGGDFGKGEVFLGSERGVERVGASRLDADDVGLVAGPGKGLDALHEAVEEAAAADGADNGVHGDVHLVAELGDEAGGAVPDVRVVKGRDEDAVGVVGDELLLYVLLSGEEVLADLLDVGAEGDELVLHELRGGEGHDNGAGAVQGNGRRGAGEAGVAAGSTVKVHIAGVMGNGSGHEVANATGLEGARGLEVVELEVDVAVVGVSVGCLCRQTERARLTSQRHEKRQCCRRKAS